MKSFDDESSGPSKLSPSSVGAAIKKAIHRENLWMTLIACLGVVVVCALVVWQQRAGSLTSSDIRHLQSEVTGLQKSDNSLASRVGQLTKNEATPSSSTSVASATPSPSPASTTTPSSLIITDVKQVPETTYVPDASSSAMWEQVDFTIKNNSSSTQYFSTYPSQVSTYIKGVTSSGEVIGSYLSADNGDAPWSASALAGGSVNGFALFDPTAGVVKLQWLAPDATQPVLISLPSQ